MAKQNERVEKEKNRNLKHIVFEKQGKKYMVMNKKTNEAISKANSSTLDFLSDEMNKRERVPLGSVLF